MPLVKRTFSTRVRDYGQFLVNKYLCGLFGPSIPLCQVCIGALRVWVLVSNQCSGLLVLSCLVLSCLVLKIENELK